MNDTIYVRKKSGNLEEWNPDKIIAAVTKSADRACVKFTKDQENAIVLNVQGIILDNMGVDEDGEPNNIIPVETVHNAVELTLDLIKPEVAISYKDYRNWVKKQAEMMRKVYEQGQAILNRGDSSNNDAVSNANSDAALCSTQGAKIRDYLLVAEYEEYFLNADEKKAAAEGYIYPHDKNLRLLTMNCCLFRVGKVLDGGFNMGNMWYNEPKSLDTAMDVGGDIVIAAASQQYGGFTIPEVDKILEKYAEKSYHKYIKEYMDILNIDEVDDLTERAEEWATQKVIRDFEQGFQGWEYKFNTVASSRGDYPFIAMTFGIHNTKWGKECAKAILKVRAGGQGKKGFKKPVLFPKLIFLYDENLHGKGKPMEDVFEAAIECSSKAMYPDYLSLTGEGYVASMYKKYGKVISPMGCEHGNEVITYKIDDRLYVESFERFWNRISGFCEVKPQPCDDGHGKYLYVDLSTYNVTIYDTKEGFVKVKKLIRNYSNSWNTVKMTNGRSWLCTTDHPFEIIDKGEVLAKDLQIGDKVTINNSSYSEETKVVPDDYAWLLGFMLCDGCYQNYSIFSSIALNGEDEIEEKFNQTFTKYFGLNVKTVIQNRGKKGNYKDLRVIGEGNGKLSNIIRELTELFGGVQKKYRHIPNEVFSWNYSAKMAFLAGMIDADGHTVDNSKHKANTVELGSTNKELALGQMYLAQALGMPARIYQNHYNKKKPDKIRYSIDFCATAELANYIACEKKKNKIYEIESSQVYNTTAEITEIINENMADYSYDVETESAHFECSGVYSHNCRAFLSPWYERGGIEPADEEDVPVFEGRFNIGVVSLNLPMILAKSQRECSDFYQTLDYYLEMIRHIHLRTYKYLENKKASINPLAFCEGGFYGGNLGLNDKIAPVLKSSTASFGITALNELQRLYNGKSIREDNSFAMEVMKYINDKIAEFKKEDGILYAIYGTPAESLCFSGDEVVQCYGGNKKIKDIKVGDLVYSYNEHEKKIELKPVTFSEKTGEKKRVIKVVMDNGQEIICTPDHPFAVRVMKRKPGKVQFEKEVVEYIPACELRPGDRIKSNYFRIEHNGRKSCSIYHNGRRQLIQDIHAEYVLGEKPAGYVTHHKDEDKTNNDFDNLEYKTDKDHRIHHLAQTIGPFQYKSEDVMGKNNPFYGKHHSEESNFKNRLAHIGRSIERFTLSGVHMESFECADDAEKAGFTRNLVINACKGNRKCSQGAHYYKDSVWYYSNECKPLLEANHKVKEIITLEETEDVYDITVEDNHNFFVGGDDGILVHNCETQAMQFRKAYGIIEGVSDRIYVTNSFHCHVTENMSPIEKQDKETKFWDLFNGGKIQYCRYPVNYNKESIRTLVRRAMKYGLYEGVNLSLAYCNDCGHEELEMTKCPKCGSTNLTKIDRMNGYLAYSLVNGDTRLNRGKMAEIAERVSM